MFTADALAYLDTVTEDFGVGLLSNAFLRAEYRMTPVYNLERGFWQSREQKGPATAYQAAIENLPDLIEDETSWDEILAFREDTDAVRKYRALKLWLEHSLQADSVEHAKDIIGKMIDDYGWALKEHGLKTATSALSKVLDWKGMAQIASGASVGAVLGGPVGSAIVGGLILGAKISVWLAERTIEHEELKRAPGSEIAIIYEARRKFGAVDSV
jgi:hypothetical protein